MHDEFFTFTKETTSKFSASDHVGINCREKNRHKVGRIPSTILFAIFFPHYRFVSSNSIYYNISICSFFSLFGKNSKKIVVDLTLSERSVKFTSRTRLPYPLIWAQSMFNLDVY